MQVVHAQQPFPHSWSKAIFLAGPTPRASRPVPSWRDDAVRLLEEQGYDGVVFLPEAENGKWGTDYETQIHWELEALHLADVILFWIPRDLDTLPGFTTNVEFGHWLTSHKIVVGHPPDAPKTRYIDVLLQEVTGQRAHATLPDTLHEVLRLIGDGAKRQGGERHVPLFLWTTPLFQGWYTNLRKAGNRLDGARVRWVFKLPHVDEFLSMLLRVDVWVEAEGRHNSNEWVFGRSDMSAVVLYGRPQQGVQLLDTQLVLVREFRSPGRTEDGFVHEVPGGSSVGRGTDPRRTAAEEVLQETSLEIAGDRLVALGSRQAAATVSTHHVHVFSAELTESEMASARALATEGTIHGNEREAERTVVEITTLRRLLDTGLVDWATVGMVARALLK